MEVDLIPPMAEFSDCLAHASSVAAHPLQFPLLRLGLYPGRRRYRHNFDTLYSFHEGPAPPSLFLPTASVRTPSPFTCAS